MSVTESSARSSVVWLAARLTVSLFYRVQRIGPAIPAGPVLLVANHPNALLDPALVQATAGRPCVFSPSPPSFKVTF